MRYLLALLRSKAIYEYFPGRRRRMASFYGSFASAGDLCFDVGAHLGNRAAALAKLGCRVIAVEPHPYLAAYLRDKFAGAPNVTVEEVGLSGTAGEATLHVSPGNLTISSLRADWAESLPRARPFSETHVVRTVTIDDLISKYGTPKYCKIDIEGLDLTVLKSLTCAIEIISFEHLPNRPEETSEAVDFLATLAPYRFNYFERETHVFRLPRAVGAAELLRGLSAAPPRNSCDIFAFATDSS